MMNITDAMQAVVPSAKGLTVVITMTVGAFMAGMGAVLGWGDYSGLPAKVSALEVRGASADSTIQVLTDGQEEATEERQRILCLVRLTATGETLSPLEVTERCP
jgi:hypothetical protein